MVTRYKIVYPNELNHFGVKGMKWGVRKQIVSRNSHRSRIQDYQTRDEQLGSKIRRDAKAAKNSSRGKRKVIKAYNKAYNSKSKELYVKNGKALEKSIYSNSKKYYSLVDAIQDQSSAHARQYVKDKYGFDVKDLDKKSRRKITYTEPGK